MKNRMKKIVSILLLSVMTVSSFSGCGKEAEKSDEIVLRVSNWEEYIDEGDWDEDEKITLEDGTEIFGENSEVKDFEDWYYKTYGKKVRVEYSTFGTNEDLYNQLTIGDTYDLVCPSEYMIMKLLSEDALIEFSEDFWKPEEEYNYYAKGVSPYIDKTLRDFEFEGESLGKYMAGYMWGTLGYIYNPQIVAQEDAEDWRFLLNEKYAKRVTAKDSVRDCYFAAMGMITRDEVMDKDFINDKNYEKNLSDKLNDTSDESIKKVEEILSKVKDNVYCFETDSGKADIVSGKVVGNLQWSGDAVYSMQQVEEEGLQLKYAIPKESTNSWFDGWCMLKKGIAGDKEKQHAAEAFVNFVSRPDNAVRNMYYIGYTPVIAGGDDDTVYNYVKDCYADDEAEDTVDYDLNYFFGSEDDEKDYVITTSEDIASGQLYAQYPTEDVMRRSVVMAYFGNEANKKISRAWIDMRCFDLKR